jgi:transcriptional regulator with XRE-family HTH domain
MENRLKSEHEHALRTAQARYLADLLGRRRISAREIARRTRVFAEEFGKPALAVGHQAVSSWVNGTRNPTPEHRKILSTILDVPFEDLNRVCDADGESLNFQSILKPATIIVHGEFQTFEYRLIVKKEIDITQPALYEKWTDMFSSPPVSLTRHLRHVSFDLFGWIPDGAASPMVRYPRCLMPLERVSGRGGLGLLDPAESSQRRVWFVYLPDGGLHVGIGYRDGRSFSFARNNGKGFVIENYPLSRVELVGCVSGNTLFHIGTAPDSRRPNPVTIGKMPKKAI